MMSVSRDGLVLESEVEDSGGDGQATSLGEVSASEQRQPR